MNAGATPAQASPAGTAPTKRPEGVAFFELSRLMVVAVAADTNRLMYKAQTKPNGPWEANWSAIDSTQTYGVMTAGITGDGRVAAIAQRAGSGLSYIDEAEDAIGVQTWNKPVDLGKPPGVGDFLFLTMAYDTDGRVEVIGTDTGSNIWWKYQNPGKVVQKTVQVTPPGTDTPITVTVNVTAPPDQPWSQWIQLPGGLAQVRAVRNADGRLIVFGINTGGHLYRNEQKTVPALAAADWAGWVQMDDNFTSTFVAMAPILDSGGAVNLFAINAGNQVLHARQSPPCTATWAAWSTPGFMRQGAQAIAAGLDGDSHLVLVATDTGKVHNMNVQTDVETQQWSGWNAFNATDYPVASALDYNADGRLTFFSHWLLSGGQFGGLWCVSQMVYDSTEWWWSWTTLAPGNIRTYTVVRDLTPPT